MDDQPGLSHEVLALLVEQGGDGIIVVDAQGVVRFFNAEAQRQHGVAPQQVPVSDWAKAFGLLTLEGQPLPLARTPLYQALQGERVADARWKVRRPDGTVVLLAGTATPLRKSDGTSLGAMIITRDESARQAREATLRDAEAARLSAILEHMPVGVMLAEAPSGKVTYANPRALEIFAGPIHAERISDYGAHFEAWHRDGRRYRTEDFPLVRALAGEVVVSAEVLFRRAHGEEAVVRANAAPIRGEGGAIVAAITTYSDVTAEVRLLDEAMAARAAAESASRAKDVFLAMLGHELRNPLTPIVAALALMRGRGDAHALREREIIERQVNHLRRLVDDLLDASRITRGTLTLERQAVELGAVLERAVESARPLLDQRRQVLRVHTPPGLMVHGDADRLSQVFANLLVNAAKYTPPGGQVAVEAAQRGDAVQVTVADDGQGIAPELLPRIFELFTQGGQPLDRATGGIGVGLTLVKTLVELHGGTVAARSPGPGKGSTFEVTLPLLRAPQAPVLAPPGPGVEPAGAVALQPVLVVDDHEDNAMLIAEFLQGDGFQVHTAHDGPAALRLAGTVQPGVAVLDIGLPGMDGFELAARLRAQLPALSLVALSGYGQQGDVARSREAGFAQHLVKPVDLDVLSRLLRALAQPRR